MIEFIPEPKDNLKARYPAAIVQVYNEAMLKADYSLRPGSKRENVFDYDDGTRLIISKDQLEDEVFIHFSASVDLRHNPNAVIIPGVFELGAIEKFNALSGNTVKPEFIGYSPEKAVPHWMIPEKI